MTTDPASLRVEPAANVHALRLFELFEREHNPCYCRYWHFTGDKYAWQDRLANHPGEGREELARALEANSPEAHGLIALRGDRAVGWLKLTHAEYLNKIYDQRVYRRLPCFASHSDRDRVYVVGCFLIDRAERRQGVATRLLQAGVAWATKQGASCIEAFPRGVTDVPDEQLMMGPLQLFLREGFQIVHDFKPYPVLRLKL